MGYLVKVFPRLLRRSHVYIFDRYFYDYLIDPRRGRLALPQWNIRMFSFVVPKPDVILCLGADPEIIHARKPELPLEETKRQIEALRRFCDSNKRAVWKTLAVQSKTALISRLMQLPQEWWHDMNDSARPDERCVSWKILLPVEHESRICAIGLDKRALAGLARSYEIVDTRPIECRQYDAVIIGDRTDGHSCDLGDLISWVKPDGVVVNAGQKYISKWLHDAGFKYSRHYAALPPEKPRLFVPLASRTLRGKGLSFHAPGSFKARVSLAASKGLSLLGLRHHLMKRTVGIYARHTSALDRQGLIHWLSSTLGHMVIDLVVFAGSESPRRKITALAVTGRQGKDVVVKIADTDLGADAIRQESQALQAIATSDISGQTPKLIAEERWYNYYIQLQEKAVGVSYKQTASLTDAHLNFLSKLSTIGRKVIPLRETPVWRDVEAMAKASCSKALSHPIRIALDRVLSDKFANMPVVCHRTHGDFTPWNIKVNNGKLFVYDWEDSLSDGLALTDIFHFLYRQASLVGPWLGAKPVLNQMADSARSLTSLVGLGELSATKFIESILTAWVVQEYLNKPCEKIAELASTLEP